MSALLTSSGLLALLSVPLVMILKRSSGSGSGSSFSISDEDFLKYFGCDPEKYDDKTDEKNTSGVVPAVASSLSSVIGSIFNYKLLVALGIIEIVKIFIGDEKK